MRPRAFSAIRKKKGRKITLPAGLARPNDSVATYSTNFRASLHSLRGDVLMMASLTDRNLQNAMSCLLDRDAQMCAVTIADEEEVDALEKKIDEDGVNILLRFQPVASDLRQVISAMKLGSNLERIADQAVKIAERSCSSAMEPVLDEAASLGPMFIEATTLFRDSVRAYADADVALPDRSGSATARSTK